MVYSCAYFRTGSESLETAQVQKLDHICTKLMLQPGDDFLDIGCGWGALVMHAARHYGVRATGVTLSENQHRLANERIRDAGLASRCRVLLQDYRDIPGEETYDKIASVGMFEHVGLKHLPEYFGAVRRLLKEQGLFLNHGITSSDTRNRAVGLGGGEFIGRYVFPKGELDRWSGNFEQHLEAAARASSERTARIWRLYLAGCAHAFEQGWISIYQVLATRQSRPGFATLPLTRDWMYRGT